MVRKSGLIIRVLRRHWLAVVAGSVTCLFLYSSLEPRPLRHEEIDLSNLDIENKQITDVAFSSDKSTGAIQFGSKKLFRLQFGTNLLTDTMISHVEHMAFDQQGELVLVTRERDKGKPGQFTHRLIRYQPSANTNNVVHTEATSYAVKLPNGMANGFSGILNMGLNGNVSAILSPDCQTMLKPKILNDSASLNFVSTLDPGKVMPLKLPVIDLKEPYTPYFEVIFSQDGQTLFLQHSEAQEMSTRYRLRWFNVKTGEQIGTRLLAEYSRLVEPCVVGATHTFGRLMSSNPAPVILSNNGQDERKLILDDIADPEKRNRPIFIDYESKFLAYIVVNDSFDKTQLTVRRLPEGDICYQQVWEAVLEAPAAMARPVVMQRNNYSVTSVLPGSLVLVTGEETGPDTQLERWIEKAREWLQLEPNYPTTKLFFIDANSRNIRGLIRLPTWSTHIKHLPELSLLCITYTDETHLHCLQYDNRLRKPWAYIAMLSLVTAAGFALLLEFSCLLVWLCRKSLAFLKRPVVAPKSP